jgi:hypothetical protein
VFTRNGAGWSQQAYLKASNTGSFDWFGRSVALSDDGHTLVAGAPFESSVATGIGGNEGSNSAQASGAAYVFTRSGSSWSQQAYIKASNTGKFSTSVVNMSCPPGIISREGAPSTTRGFRLARAA